MKPLEYPAPLNEVISQLRRLPSVGTRGAERMALWLLRSEHGAAMDLSKALASAIEGVGECPNCGFFSIKGQLCECCADSERDVASICVVEQATDVLPLERCGAYRGLYHCLGGKISPLDGVMPENLSIAKLITRVSAHPGCEVILAVGSDVEGEATALFLADALAPLECTVTRLAQGMPAGAGLGHADAITLMRALEGRKGVSP